MSYPTRRARIEAEKAQQVAQRFRRTKTFSLSLAGLATAAGATFAGLPAADAAIDDVPVQSAPAASSSTTSTAASSSASYTVKSGDTLSAIAAAQGVSLSKLMNDNGLSASTIIYPGDELQLPAGTTQTTAQNGSSTTTAQLASSVQTASSATGAKATVINKALEIVNSGAGYRYGGNGPSAYDCSGMTKAAFAAAGINIPRTSSAQFSGATSHVSLSNLQPGDLVFWSNNGAASGIYHVAIYIGDGKIAQARNPQSGITVNSLAEYSQYNPPLATAARY